MEISAIIFAREWYMEIRRIGGNMAKLNDFLNYLQEQVDNHSIYVWGAQGQGVDTISETWIKKVETSSNNATRAINYWIKQVKLGFAGKLKAFDCSGLGMYWLQKISGLSKTDMNANGMKGKCKKLDKTQLKKGDWVFRVKNGQAYHIGYVVDDALQVIEAKGRDDGVIKRTINAGGASYWNAFGRPSYFADEIEAGQPVTPTKIEFERLIKLTNPMMRGEDVSELQRLLLNAGYSPGSIDGVFGTYTQTAVKAYQKAQSLKVDGIAGRDTITALGGVWKG